jgi:hypothetical protein
VAYYENQKTNLPLRIILGFLGTLQQEPGRKVKYIILFHSPPDLITFHGYHLPIPAQWGLRFQHISVDEGDKNSLHQQLNLYSEPNSFGFPLNFIVINEARLN